MKPQWTGLVGDVGGTNARFALVDAQGHARHPRTYACRGHASLAEVISEYLAATAGGRPPPRAVIAVAGPVLDGEIEFTNLDWVVSEGELLAHFEFEAVKLINDFAAQALAAPLLEGPDLRILGPEQTRVHEAPVVALGAGTGFGVAGLARNERGDIAIATEGGHASFAPSDEVELEVWRRLQARFGRVSKERVLSGQGLYDLYGVLADLQGGTATLPDEIAVTAAGLAGDPLASETLDRFAGILGSVAGDLALTFGARGGVYVSGGIAPRIADRLAGGAFRSRFEAKGRLTDYVRAIPTYLVLHPHPALIGAARELAQMERL